MLLGIILCITFIIVIILMVNRQYLQWLRELVSLGVYKAFGDPRLRNYRVYFTSGFTPYSAVYQQFEDCFHDDFPGVIPPEYFNPDSLLTVMDPQLSLF